MLQKCNTMQYRANMSKCVSNLTVPAVTFSVLQRAQTNLARVLCQRGSNRCQTTSHVAPLAASQAASIEWHKMVALTFKTMSSSTPAYLSDQILTAVLVRPLRSSDAPLLNITRTQTELARRSFSVAAPHTWNSLSSDVRSCRTVDTFKWHFKTHLFRQS